MLVALSACVYLVVTSGFAMGLLRKRPLRSDRQPLVSIVIAARNEEDFIGNCLDAMCRQTYPDDRFEIIVVDDDSIDRTPDIIARYNRVISLSPSPQFAAYAAKKRPMATGIAHARGEIILTTDADCTVPDTWVATMVAHFTEDVDLVVGYSHMAPVESGWVHRFQSFDFFALLAAAAGAANRGTAWAATGQNLAYRRELFDLVGGFASISNRPSGDDVLLTQLFRRHGGRSAFCFDPGGYATTWRSESFIDLINQRKRWASNAAAQLKLNPVLFAYVASVLLVNTLPLVALIVGGKMVIACLVIWSLRLVADATVIGLATKRLNTSPNLTYFPTWLILQIPYVLVVGIGGSLLGFKWKGRTHRAQTSQPVPRILNDQPETDHVPM